MSLIQERMDDDMRGGSQITGGAGGTKIGRDRKQSPAEMRRTKAVGGGKTVPAKSYNPTAIAGKSPSSFSLILTLKPLSFRSCLQKSYSSNGQYLLF